MKLIIIKIKSLFIPFLICLFTILLILYSNSNIIAVKNGIKLWAFFIVPSMFPFFIATNLLIHTNIIPLLGEFLNKIMRPIFNIPGQGVFPLIMGIISGYPVGAKTVCDLKQSGVITKIEAERLIAYTNNSSPLFIIGTVGISMFHSQKIGVLLFLSHIISCLIVGFIFRFWKFKEKNNKDIIFINNNEISFYNLGEVLSISIKNSIESIFLIGGFIVFFSIVVSILETSSVLYFCSNLLQKIFNINSQLSTGIIISLIELTNGLKNIAISNDNSSIIICSFLLGLGGFSIFMQILSFISKTKISIWTYVLGKLLQACFSVIVISIFLYFL